MHRGGVAGFDGWLPRCLEASFSQGRKWNMLISKYIGTIPVSGDGSCAAEQRISGMLPP
jgi:hypothetical protein